MTGVEIKPGVWVNPEHVSEIKVEFCREEYEMASFKRYKFEKDLPRVEAEIERFATYDPVHSEGLRSILDRAEKDAPKVTIEDFKKPVVYMENGNRYVVDTDLHETLGIIGWDDGVA